MSPKMNSHLIPIETWEPRPSLSTECIDFCAKNIVRLLPRIAFEPLINSSQDSALIHLAKALRDEDAISKNPDISRLHLAVCELAVKCDFYHLATVADRLIDNGLTREAELAIFVTCLAFNHTSWAVHKIAYIYEQEKAFDRTAEIAHQFYRLTGDPEACYQLVFALDRLNKSDEGIQYLLPYLTRPPSPKYLRLAGFLFKRLGYLVDAIDALESAVKQKSDDYHSIRVLAELYTELGSHEEALSLLERIPKSERSLFDRASESVIYRFMGELENAIRLNDELIKEFPDDDMVYWTQCFNLSISSGGQSQKLLYLARKYWELTGLCADNREILQVSNFAHDRRIRIGFLSSDIGEHVVSNFLVPILRGYDRTKYCVELFSSYRKFEEKAIQISQLPDAFFGLHDLSLTDAQSLVRGRSLDVLIDTNGFTRNSGLPLLTTRLAPIQCHYIGYHGTTGLDSVDFFIGDQINACQEIEYQFSEQLVRLPSLWMAYDSTIEFPVATPKSNVAFPVLGSFSQVSKINSKTLRFWGAAMNAIPDSILVLKDRGYKSTRTRSRIQNALQDQGISPSRINFFESVASFQDHLDCYNAIDIALDTTDWSSSTTAFESFGMGVPMAVIAGNSFSAKMSSSIAVAAGFEHLIGESVEEFAGIVAGLASSFAYVRENKASTQAKVRGSALFDEARICSDFFETMEDLINASRK